jgi:3-oxoacyl-[acyl-carrier-protein] synthase II
MGEAAAVVLLRSEHARCARAKIDAELGAGISSDASHMTEPDPTGENPARAMMALATWRRPTEVGYERATSTRRDLPRRVIKRAFGEEHATTKLAVSRRRARRATASARPAPSRPLHRAGNRGLESPADDQLRERRPDCDLDYVPNVARPARPGRRRLELVRLRRA